MPRVRKLGRTDPREAMLRSEIKGIIGYLQITQNELAKLSGISQTTMSNRIGRTGDIRSMTFGEYWSIMDAAKKMGYEPGNGKAH